MNTRSIFRCLLAFGVAPAVASVLYGLLSWGADLAPYILVLTLAVAYALTLLLMLPLFFFLRKVGRYSLVSALVGPGIALGLVCLVWSVISYQGYRTLETSAGVLVREGSLTVTGWLNVLADSALLAGLGALAGAVFFALCDQGKGVERILNFEAQQNEERLTRR